MISPGGVTGEYYYSLLFNLYLQGDLTELQIKKLTELKAQLESVSISEAEYMVSQEIGRLPDREELRKQLQSDNEE